MKTQTAEYKDYKGRHNWVHNLDRVVDEKLRKKIL
jgi:hypothetical protein